jgi:hypothetical protein
MCRLTIVDVSSSVLGTKLSEERLREQRLRLERHQRRSVGNFIKRKQEEQSCLAGS